MKFGTNEGNEGRAFREPDKAVNESRHKDIGQGRRDRRLRGTAKEVSYMAQQWAPCMKRRALYLSVWLAEIKRRPADSYNPSVLAESPVDDSPFLRAQHQFIFGSCSTANKLSGIQHKASMFLIST